jgi:hypothetical protein
MGGGIFEIAVIAIGAVGRVADVIAWEGEIDAGMA